MAKLVHTGDRAAASPESGSHGGGGPAKATPVSVSMGLMLESAAERLCQRGGPHFGSPDKLPARRLATLRTAGELRVPMTTGLLIGIGETRRERLDSLLALREIQDEHGNLQELIIQNFRAKPGTKMAHAPEPPWRNSSGPSQWQGCCSGPGCRFRRRPTCNPTGWRAWCGRVSTIGVACRP